MAIWRYLLVINIKIIWRQKFGDYWRSECQQRKLKEGNDIGEKLSYVLTVSQKTKKTVSEGKNGSRFLGCCVVLYGEGIGNPLQYSCLENPEYRGAWWAAVHRVAQSWTWLKRLSMRALEKKLATHSSILTWRIPGTEEPGGLLSMGSHRVGYKWSNLAAAAAAMVLRWLLLYICPNS